MNVDLVTLQLALDLDSDATAADVVAIVARLYQDQLEQITYTARCVARSQGLSGDALERVATDACVQFNRRLRLRAGVSRATSNRCSQCDGAGTLDADQPYMMMQRPQCPRCGGTGKEPPSEAANAR